MHEVFYADDGSINGYTTDPVLPRAEDSEGLAEEFERYRRALAESVLDFNALEAEAEGRRAKRAEPDAAPEPAR